MLEYIEQIRELYSEDPTWRWFELIAFAGLITFLIKIILKIIVSRVRKIALKSFSADQGFVIGLINGLKSGVIFIWIFYVSSADLAITSPVKKGFQTIVVLASLYQFSIWGFQFIEIWRQRVLKRRIEQDPSSSAALGLLHTAIKVAFVTVLLLIGLSNLGVNISALMAGLGVGGIAVALAAQNVLGDLLASLSIVLDKPFVVGDFIITGNEKGTVEHIGIKSTRLRSLSGEELILPNKDLLESRVQNFKRMWQRRVVQKFGVIYSTPVEKLEQIPRWIGEIVSKEPKLRFERCHFMGYGTSSLDFELVFFVSAPEYNICLDVQQNVLLDIYKKFSEEKVEFALPTQTLYIEKLSKRLTNNRESIVPN